MDNDIREYTDAIGYLDDLVTEINQPWFKLLRDVVIINNSSMLDPTILEDICKVLLGESDDIPSITSSAQQSDVVQTANPTDFLEQMTSFSNFKLLSNDLQLNFDKRITIIFGTNGSGKSSLCESFKILSNTDKPKRPIKNLRHTSSETPSFTYKFKNNATSQTWTPSLGYGIHSDKIKYFDSSVAAHNVTVAVEPGRVIVLAPFKLGIFESVKMLTTQIRDELKRKQEVNTSLLSTALVELNTKFQEYEGSSLKSITISTMGTLSAEISKAETFDKQNELTDLLTSKQNFEKAASDVGLKALKLEHHELGLIINDLQTIVDAAKELWTINPSEKSKILEIKKAAQQTIAYDLIPNGVSLDGLLALIGSASAICNLDSATGQVCPLCRRNLEKEQIELFKKYHELVSGQLETDISKLNTEIDKSTKLINKIQTVNMNAWDKQTTIPSETIEKYKNCVAQISSACSLTTAPSPEVLNVKSSLKEMLQFNTKLLESKATAIKESSNGRDAILQKLEILKSKISPLQYQDCLSKNIEKLRKTQQLVDKSKAFQKALSVFTPLMTKITLTSKIAYEKLVVVDFETRLNQEYKNLTEKDMTTFGVVLKRIGSDASVTVKPQVGSSAIEEVLSEGELRMHSLALFFAELECSSCPVLVFDDPASSFDYNYISNYCIRLRNFALAHQQCQIIILTHNWEFFVQMQTKLNKSALCNDIDVQILENCSFVSEYSEKLETLKNEIKATLILPNEPTNRQKEKLAGDLRRLIESIINTHVFNNQRSQYKQRGQNSSEFRYYTKIVPLTSDEARELSDLYGKLSISEHDDPRNAIINTDKETFQNRYDKILEIETAIISRK